MSTITPFLTFDDQAEQAARFYVSLLPNSKITATSHFGAAAPFPEGTVMTVSVELDGRPYTFLNGGPHFTFSEGFSLAIACKTQDEIDRYWNALVEGGEPSRCGWLQDRFGVTWQVFPTILPDLFNGPDAAGSARAFQAMLTMQKLDIAALQRAYGG